MFIDAIVILVLLMCALMGYLRGILRGTLWVGALALAYFGSPSVAGPFAGIIAKGIELPTGLAHTMGRVAAGIVIYASVLVSGRIADRRIGRLKSGVLRPWNRNLGALMGLIFGTLLMFCALCLADAMVKVFPEREGFLADSIRSSRLRKAISGINPADRFLITDLLKLLNAAREDPRLLRELKAKEEYRQLLNHPKVQEVLDDEQLMEAVRQRRWQRVLRDRKIRALLKDKELRKLLFSRLPPTPLRGEPK